MTVGPRGKREPGGRHRHDNGIEPAGLDAVETCARRLYFLIHPFSRPGPSGFPLPTQ
ncbi:hypothetical protein AZ78_1151 [Lysobacter capsici AZ78]|uniref:Uncharacterized protein n=1 Tax=Lysobacter capsici AZ78 TaxID=1444315 RepID=A0A120AFV0_9GAMM|nr:hypothetical protein AZ78_1151 [Lysobacter capsici AZ78]